jgi:hypothetical protein
MRDLGAGMQSRPDISWSSGVAAADAMGFSLGQSTCNVILKRKEPHVVDNGLIMVSRMGMVVKPGAFGAPLCACKRDLSREVQILFR